MSEQKLPEAYLPIAAKLNLPDKVGFELSELQAKDLLQFVEWGRCCIFYAVGGGKTVVSSVKAILAGAKYKVVIVPPVLLRPWFNWLSKLSGSVLMYRGSPKQRKAMKLADYEWVVMSHAIFRQDFTRLITESTFPGEVELIVDEAQALKNAGSVLYKNVSLFSAGRNLQLLTGTPVNKPIDAYAYIKLMSPDAYRTLAHFEALHVADRDFFKQPTAWQNLDLAKENLYKRAVARTKEELHGYNLVPLTPDSEYDLSEEHYALYAKLVDEMLLTFPDGSVIDAGSVHKLRHALQQVVVNLDYFTRDEKARSAAYDMIDLSINETGCSERGNSKLIVWTKYKLTSRSVLRYCNGLGIKTVAAYSEADTEKSITSFMDDESTRILVAQYQSAGAGLNPQYVCSEALFLELDPVPLYITQAMGRIDRFGQTKKPRMRFATARGTVQVDLLHSLLHKDDLAVRVNPDKGSIRKMLLGQPQTV